MKFTKALYLAISGLAALSNPAPLPVNTAVDLKRDPAALPMPFLYPLPVAEPAKRDAETA